jgi:hypothetical protein
VPEKPQIDEQYAFFEKKKKSRFAKARQGKGKRKQGKG